VAFNRKVIDISQRNVNSGFDLTKSLAGAKNLFEIATLQASYWRKISHPHRRPLSVNGAHKDYTTRRSPLAGRAAGRKLN
jgi:hypothetical protein